MNINSSHLCNLMVSFSLQVHLSTEPYVYSEISGNTLGEKVNKNLLFDLSHSNLYITTEKKVCT